ncbi:MAG: diadenylate cyclase CdaA [Bacteroidota bacterium]
MIQIGFLPVTIWDILDVLIVGYLMYRIYKLLRGSIAFNIFIGVITLLVTYWLVYFLDMKLLTRLLDSLAKTGVLILVIIFQPEIRRFLLYLGDSTLRQRSNFWMRLINKDSIAESGEKQKNVQALKSAILRMSEQKTGALIVLANDLSLELISNSGVMMNADISSQLLNSIFNKDSPLHDGAVIIADHVIRAASCILPVSDNLSLPSSVGLRHRAAVGISERANVAAFIVSEETGAISCAFEGILQRRLSEDKLLTLLNQHYQ